MAKPKPLPSREVLDRILAFDAATGVLTWKVRADRSSRWNSRWAGTVAGFIGTKGYRKVCINGSSFAAHRIIWKLVNGDEPPEVLDHKDRDKAQNSIANLRPSDDASNQHNTVRHRDKRDDLPKGVDRHGRTGMYRSRISKAGDRFYLGWFDDPEAAATAYREAAKILHGEFARTE